MMARTKNIAANLARLFNLAPHPVYVLDDRRTMIFCNRACAEWAGLPAAELIGRRLDYYSSDPRATAPGVAAGLCPPPAAFAGKEVVGHVSCLGADGRLHYRRARFLPLGEETTDLVGVAAFVDGRDLTPTQLEQDLTGDRSANALHAEIRRFRANQAQHFSITQLIGRSPAVQQARGQALVAAESRCSAVISGMPGSGRMHLARAIHYHFCQVSKTEAQLVPLSCGLISAERFRWTLTNALRESDRQPTTILFQDADGLDDSQQHVLADMLHAARRRPLLLATSRRPLTEIADCGEFHRELACLLSTLEIRLPPLAERPDDLPLLAQWFLEEENRAGGKQVGSVSPEALDLLLLHRWPGNLDELAETIRAAHRATADHSIKPEDLPARLHFASQAARYPRQPEETIVLEEFLSEIELELIRRALKQAGGNKTKAARLLGMNRPRFYRRMEQLGLAEHRLDAVEFEIDDSPAPPGDST